MSKQSNNEKNSRIIPIEGEDGIIRFKHSENDFHGNSLADVSKHIEKMNNMYYSSEQKNATVNSLMTGLMTGNLNYFDIGTLYPTISNGIHFTKGDMHAPYYNLTQQNKNCESTLTGDANEEASS
ncbi:MAG TPA: hypothetical protein LFW21_06570 [Rickettsia endosymbiont of Pyrocoelia pectoralis]|nr:hypothetical protein [Rickettsia endosymbiont of Pyrocoelia pectoralis]